MSGPAWTHFPHEGDVGHLRLRRQRRGGVRERRAMTAVVVPLEALEPREGVAVAVEAPDLEILLVDWLNAVIYEMATRRMLFRDFRVEIAGSSLRGEARGEPVDRERHAPAVELKGATFTELRVAREPDGRWRAQCVIDV